MKAAAVDAGPRQDVPGLARLELDRYGVILDCTGAAARVLGFAADALRGQHVSRVFPQLATGDLLREGRVNPRLAFLCRCGFPLEGTRADGGRVAIAFSPYVLRNGGAERVLLAWSPPGATAAFAGAGR